MAKNHPSRDSGNHLHAQRNMPSKTTMMILLMHQRLTKHRMHDNMSVIHLSRPAIPQLMFPNHCVKKTPSFVLMNQQHHIEKHVADPCCMAQHNDYDCIYTYPLAILNFGVSQAIRLLLLQLNGGHLSTLVGVC
jgi:hypothetical protein